MPLPKIVQFAPDSQFPSQGTYGWGFDTEDGFRVVLYRPEKFDLKMVKAMDKKIQQLELQKREEEEHIPEKFRKFVDDKGHRRAKKRWEKKEEKQRPVINRDEHGPAHVHVIHMESGRESKFELIEPAEANEYHARLLKNGNGKSPLTPQEAQSVLPLLNENCSRFIKLWRMSYQDTILSNYVTRVSEKVPAHYERIYFIKRRKETGKKEKIKEKLVALEDRATGEITVVNFDDYVAYTPTPHHR